MRDPIPRLPHFQGFVEQEGKGRGGHTCSLLEKKTRRKSGHLETTYVVELPELFQLKCLSSALEARPHLNGNNPSIPRI
jgi:hypothetical protein